MKNLKKVLLALVVVAMLVSSVVTIAIANESEPEYTGSVEEALKLYDAAVKAAGAGETPAYAAQSTEMVKFYAYIDANPIDPASEGYADLIEAADLLTYEVAIGLYGAYEKSKSTENLATVYTHIASAAPTDKTIAIDEVAYSDFEKLVNFASLEYADSLVDALFEKYTSGTANYYEYLAAQQALTKFFNEVKSFSYKEEIPNAALYTGNVGAVQALLNRVKASASVAELQAGLAEIYTYLRTTPVNPATDEFAAFLKGYNTKCATLMNKFDASVADAKTIAEQVKLLKDMRAFLVATPLSEVSVKAFNDTLKETVDSYINFAGNFAEGQKLAAELADIETITLGTDITELTALITALEAIVDNSNNNNAAQGGEPSQGGEPEKSYIEKKIEAFAKVYNYLAANEIDPATEGYAELVAKYNAELNLIVNYLAAAVTEPTDVSDKLDALEDFGDFLAAYPVSEDAIAKYETIKADVVELCTNFSKALKKLVFPTYTPKAPAYISTNVEMLNYMLSNIKGELATQKVGMSAMYTYLLSVEIDTEAEGYDAFLAAYNAKRAEFTTALFATIDAAEAAAKVDAFKAVKDYLVATPYSYDAVVAFNNKVAEAYPGDEGKVTRESLTIGGEYIYFTLAELFDFLFNVEEEHAIADILAAIETVYAYSLRQYDATEDPYYIYIVTPGQNGEPDDIYELTFSEAFDEIFDFMGSSLVEYAMEGADNADIETVSLVCEFFKKVPFSEDAINSFVEKISKADDPATEGVDEGTGLIYKFLKDADTVNESFAKPSYIYNELNKLIVDFNKAEGLDNRIEAFKAIYAAKAKVEDVLLTSVQAADAAFRAAYADVCAKMAAEIVASVVVNTEAAPSVQIDSFNKAYDFLKDYKFSQAAVDGYNAKLEAVKVIDFEAVATQTSTECTTLVYTSPENTENKFELIQENIDAIGSADEANLEKAVVKAYKCFGGDYKKAKPVDFAKKEFAAVVESFSSAKAAAIAKYRDAVKEASLADMPEKLDAMYKFIKKNVSSYMVDEYDKTCDDVAKAFSDAFNNAYAPYKTAVEAIHNHFKKVPVDLSLLSEAELAIYEDVELKLDALEYAEVYGQILVFQTTSGEDKYTYILQKQAADSITGYLSTYGIADEYSEYALANSLFAQAAEDFMVFYADFIDFSFTPEQEDMKAQAIASLKQFVEKQMYCKPMVDLYNAIFASGDADKIEFKGSDYIPDEATGTLGEYADLMKAYMSVQLRVLGENEEYTPEDYNICGSGKLKALVALFEYLGSNPLNTKSPMGALEASVNAAKLELEKLAELQKQKADAQTPESDYELTSGHTIWSFEDGKHPSLSQAASVKSSSVVSETRPDGTENKYWFVETVGTSAYWNITLPSTTMPSVFEFDVRLTTGEAPMTIDFRPVGSAPNVSGTAYQFNLWNDGVFSRFNEFDPQHPEGMSLKISDADWTHIIIVLDPVEYKYTMYIDYVLIGTVDLVHNNTTNPLTATGLRLNLQTKDTSVSFDNIQYYIGSSYRIHDKFASMTEDDKFKYYVDFFSNEDYAPVGRAVAYNKAKSIVDSYRGVAGFESYVQAYDLFDYDSIFSPEAKAAKLAKLVEDMNNSGAELINTKTYESVAANLKLLEVYMAEESYYLDQSTFEYNDVKARIANGYAEIERVKNLLDLIDVLELFTKANTVAGMTRRAAAVTAAYEKCDFTDVDNYAKASNDPAIIAFLKTVGDDITLSMFYNEVIPQAIANRTTFENASKIVKGVEKLVALVENADELSDTALLEAVMAAAKENYDYANAYMTAIRNNIKADNYDKSYEGLDEAIAIFDYLDVYFYQLVVEDQLAVIKGQLDRYSLTDSYIDKLGVVTYVRNYIAENSVDLKDSLIAPYYTMLLAFEEELKSYEDEYKSILESNTAAFIAIVERMSAFVEYKDIKPLYDEALNNYFYNMNQDSEAAKAAVATFNVYDSIVKATEENSKLFVAAAEKLSAATKTKAIYLALVECAAYVDGVDSSIEGVAAALQVYNAKLSAYNAKINPVNDQIDETSNVVCSVRTVVVDATVLATFKKIINK